MKIFKNNNGVVKGFLATAMATAVMVVGCDTEETVSYSEDSTVPTVVTDPYIQVVSPFFPFEAGKKYGMEINVINGVKEVDELNVYATYTDAGTKVTEDEVLIATYDVTGDFRSVITDSLTYDDLKVAGPLPENQEDVFPGSGWSFRFEGVRPDGSLVSFPGGMNIVLSKYAGIYEVSNSVYMRIQQDPAIFPPPTFTDGVARWNGTQTFIGFVDENTLSYNDRWGYFSTPGCSWEFSYDEAGNITEIVLSDGIVCASATATLATCSDPSQFANLSTYVGYNVCEESNIIIDNEVTGEHVIKLTYGYVGAGGVRQFTETLTKVVD
jgi:YD repeat-containing protein